MDWDWWYRKKKGRFAFVYGSRWSAKEKCMKCNILREMWLQDDSFRHPSQYKLIQIIREKE